MAVLDDIKQIIVDIKDIPEEDIKLESSFTEDLDADSLDMVEMLMQLEEKYDIHVPEEDAEKIKIVQDLVNYIEARI
jgi:acyl carrier protein